MAKSTYPKQWATVFVLLYGNKTIKPSDFKAMLRLILYGKWEVEEEPVSYTEKTAGIKNQVITNGLWQGRDTINKGPIVTAVKWNIRKKDHKPVTDEDLGALRNEYRTSIIPLLNKLGIASEYMSARVYLTPFDTSVDKGVPKLPAIPREPKPPKPKPVPPKPEPIVVKNLNWLYWVGGGLLGYLVLKNATKRRIPVFA